MKNGTQISILASIIIAITVALTGCNEPLMILPDGSIIALDSGMMNPDSSVTPDASTSDTATLVATLKSGVTFVVTGTSVEGVTCVAPFIVQGTNIESLTGPTCTVDGQTVTCTNVPREEALDLRSCIRDSAGVTRIINLSAQSEGCPLQRNEWESIKADGVELTNEAGIDTDSGTSIYCRIEL